MNPNSPQISNPYYPVAGKMDFEIAEWAIQQGPTQSAFTTFLDIEGVREKLQLSYNNSRALNQIIDHELPALADWSKSIIHVDGLEDDFELYMRDPVEIIKALWANPAYLEYMTYAPERHFSDDAKKDRMYDEMTSGDWCWKTQVSIEKLAKVESSDILDSRLYYLMGPRLFQSSLALIKRTSGHPF
ncbi:hypothetical protein BJ138DRAFT_1021154 [Hygrophoropsis aurantiaca]|uniref:Uncharacterized protein n=1 Tax=Hygrophoropsis aurantiaca TaxID=72124 RepID=A0ACB7ZPU8_9AGAM|nr:hypothetical protein BJ138DRAFT_1021154 [Hygrophoropsis aurantiaca]